MQLSPVQLIAGSYVTDNGVAPAPALFVETYGTTGVVAHPALGQYVVTLDAVSRSIKPGNIVKVTPIGGDTAMIATVEQTGDLATGPSRVTVYLWTAAGSPVDGDFYFEVTQLPSSKLP